MAATSNQRDLEANLLQRSGSQELRKQHSSHWHVPSHKHIGGVDEAHVRAGFVRKVYGILGAQMLFTTGFCCVCMFNASIRESLTSIALSGNSLFFQLALWIPTMLSLCFLTAAKNSYPMNFLGLFIFTACISLNVGMVCATMFQVGYGILIAEAFGITGVIFVSLSAYTILSGKNFGFMGGFLFCGLVAMCAWGFAAWLFGFSTGLIYALCGAILFSGYIIFDTWRITQVFGCDDYIVAAIELYLDIINLFLYILQILASENN